MMSEIIQENFFGILMIKGIQKEWDTSSWEKNAKACYLRTLETQVKEW